MSLDLPYFNNTSYPLAVKQQLQKIPYTDEVKELLHFHQFVPREFFTRNKHIRGLLFVHTMGTGKTRLAVSIADYFRQHDHKRPIRVLLPKSLEANFKKTIREFASKDDTYIDANYKFISLNASNMHKQIENINKSKEEIQYEKRLGDFMDDIQRGNSLDNSMLIIDEAHNLFNSISNGSKNGLALYDTIINAKNLKLIFLTGTPIINDPFELVPCFNMLRGPMQLSFKTRVVEAVKEGSSGIHSWQTDESSTIYRTYSQTHTDDLFGNSPFVRGSFVDENPPGPYILGGNKHHIVPEIIYQDYSQSTPTHHDDTQSITTRSKYNDQSYIGGKSMDKPRSKKQAEPSSSLLFSESYDEFADYFIDRKNKKVKNREVFSNRVYGLTSYYGDLYFDTTKERDGFPKKLKTKIQRIPMSGNQYAAYSIARDAERKESSKGYRGANNRFASMSGGSSTYRVRSRQISNYCIPEYALGTARGGKSRPKFIDRIKIEDLLNTKQWSPKMGAIYENIQSHPDQLGIVYSQFVSGEGVNLFARILSAYGWNDFTVDDSSGFDLKPKKVKTYAILSGSVNIDTRQSIISTFNSADNAHGEKIQLLLISGALAEGIDLKRVRQVHIMEPFWNLARINQVETRAIRYKSHDDLPESERNVQVYIYLSDYPKNLDKLNKPDEETTDVDMYTKSIDNMAIINDFIHVLAETSIDCSLHYPHLPESAKRQINCKLCSPNDKQLFNPLLQKDINTPSNCEPHTEVKVSVKEISLPETKEKYYYKITDGEIDLFMYNHKLQGFTPMPRTHYMYGALMKKITSEEL